MQIFGKSLLGINASNEALLKYKQMKHRSNIAYLIFKVNDRAIDVDKKVMKKSFTRFKQITYADHFCQDLYQCCEPRFGVIEWKKEYIFVYWSPIASNLKHKMTYAAIQASFFQTLSSTHPLDVFIQATDKNELISQLNNLNILINCAQHQFKSSSLLDLFSQFTTLSKEMKDHEAIATKYIYLIIEKMRNMTDNDCVIALNTKVAHELYLGSSTKLSKKQCIYTFILHTLQWINMQYSYTMRHCRNTSGYTSRFSETLWQFIDLCFVKGLDPFTKLGNGVTGNRRRTSYRWYESKATPGGIQDCAINLVLETVEPGRGVVNRFDKYVQIMSVAPDISKIPAIITINKIQETQSKNKDNFKYWIIGGLDTGFTIDFTDTNMLRRLFNIGCDLFHCVENQNENETYADSRNRNAKMYRNFMQLKADQLIEELPKEYLDNVGALQCFYLYYKHEKKK
eukprot:411650_1